MYGDLELTKESKKWLKIAYLVKVLETTLDLITFMELAKSTMATSSFRFCRSHIASFLIVVDAHELQITF